MRKILLFALLCGSLFTAKLYAQFPGCPSVNIAQGTNGVLVLPCNQACTNLTATAFAGAQTTAYTVGSIPYAPPFPFNTGTQILVNTDDIWSGVISLPFNFCFFGNTYNRIIVGSNGVCSFNVTNAAAGNSWQIPGTIPSATPADLTNSIMCPWQDIDPTNQGQVFYEIGGSYPCRYFKVSWFNVPYYGDPNSVNTTHCQGIARRATQQVILYETSNVIDMYIERKDVCSDWNNGRATQGIQNANGTVAYVVPGRNASVWTATNDAQRFTPSGAANYTIAWFNGATQIGTGNTVNVCPVGGTTYRAEATYADCAGTQVVVNSYLYVNTSGVTSTVDSVHEVDCFNGTTGAAYASFNSNSAVLSYGWSPGGTPNSTSITGIGPGTYTFTVTDASNCTSSSTVTLTNPAAFSVNVPDTSITSCNGGTASLTATPTGGVAGYTYLWTPGNSTNQTITGIGSGTYTVTVTDSRNCTATDAGTVTITGSNPIFNPPVITDATCAGNNGSIVVSVAGAAGTVSYTWSPTQPDNDTITGLAAGTYSVTATDGNGCTVSATYTVGGGAPIAFGAPVITDATCAGNDGSIVVTITGATDPISYNWSPAQPDNDTITGLAAGSYSVTATDANGCTASATYNVGAGTPITFGAPVITDASCTGLTGSIVVTVTGATDPISYNWSPAQPDNDTITGLAAGSYSVTATDANGCTASATYNVGAGNGISFGPAVLQNASCSANDGGIIVTVNNATQPIDYVWSNGLPNNDTVGGLGAGIYNVTATDANGCSASASYTITKAATFTFNPPVITDASCGASNGSIVVSVSGATPPLDYAWTGGLPNNDTVTGLAAGSYTVTVTDANGCADFATYTVGQNNNFTLGAPVITNAGCTTNDGSIVVTTPGAAQPVTFVWSPAQANNDTITGLAVGNYSVTATDANGCTASATYNVGQNTSIVITNATVNDVSCSGSGSISVTATGGTGTLTYTWAPTGSGNPATGLAAGTYTLTITDQGGCSLTATYIVGNTPCGDCPAVSTDNNVTIPCGESCTTLAATAIAGYKTTAYSGAPIAYNPTAAFNTGTPILANIDDTWSGVITLPFNFCFFGNTYNQLIVGSNGIVSFNINQANGFNEWEIPGPLPSTATPDVRNAIMGPWHDMDPTFAGSISYSVIDSYPCRKFVVSWFDTPMFGDPNSVNDGICNGEYHQTQQIVLYETTNVIDIYIQEKESCVDWNDGLAVEGIQNAAGTVAYTVPGRNATVWSASNDGYRFTPAGAPNYVINWFEGNAQIGSGDTITVCPDSSTIYRVEAVYTNCDNSTITVSDSVFVTVEGSVTVSIDSFTNVSCNGGNDGAVYASYTSTDSTIVSFGWTPNGAGLTSLTGIPAGTYVFSATNAAGCTVTDTVVLSEPAPLVANVPDTTVYNCVQGPVTVSLTATATGGTSAYGFEWAGGQTTATITVNAAGTYTVTVTDANGCTATDAGTVTQVIADPIFNTPVITNVTCNGADNGSIVVSVSQATPPITYNWSNGLPANDTVTDLDPGTYTVTATDANGCSVTASYDITEPAAIVIGNPTITDAGCTVGGTITVTATGGTGTLTYDWSNGDSGTFADSLAAGNHTLTVTDASGCTATATYTVNAAPGTVAFGQAVVVNVSCNGGNNGSVHVVVTGGTAPFTYVWSPNVSTDSTADGLAAGTYNVTVTDNQGCSASTTNTVTQPSVITLGTPVITPATCTVGGTVTVIATGGTGALTYDWSNGDSGNLADSISGGTVTLTVTDVNGCSTSATYNVPSNSITLGSTVVTNVTCNGANDGSVHVVITNGTAPYVYVWSPNISIDSTADGLSAGTYNVTVVDASTCSASGTYTITEPTAVVITDTTVVDGSCATAGSITLTVTGGTGAYTYQWSGGLSGNPATNVQAGTYSVTVRDANNCSTTGGPYTVAGATGGPLVFGNPVINNASCNGGTNGSITASATGGSGIITYTWNTSPVQQTGATATGLTAGTYVVSAVEQGGCSATASYTITEPAALTVVINATSLLCFGSEEGVATAVASGGTPNYTYEWNDNQTTPTIDSLPVGIVLVTVTDANGCTASTSFIIGQSPAISYNSQVNQPSCADLGRGTEILTPRGGTGPITVSIPSENITVTLSMVGADTVYVDTFATGNYNFTLTDSLGCSISGFFFVEAGAANQTFDVTTDSTSCFGDNFNNGGVTVTPTTMANGPYTYSLDGGQFQTDSIFTGVGAGNHIVVVSNKYGCLDTLDAVVEQPAQLFVNATPDTIITAAEVGNQITVDAQNFVNPVYVWTPATGLSCDSCNNPLATVSANTVYYLVVSEDGVEGCQASDSVVVIINGKLKMPNAFTPNADGKNDTYGPFDGSSVGLTVTEFRIYNRWGQIVHNTPEDWDGKFKGQDQPAGTYIYYITVRTPDEANPGTDKTIQEQGAFTLLR